MNNTQKFLSVCLAFLMIFLLAACKGGGAGGGSGSGGSAAAPDVQTAVSAETGLTLSVPADWKTIKAGSDVSFSYAAQDESQCMMLIEEPASDLETGLTLDAYSDLLIQAMQAIGNSTDWQVGELTDTTVGADTAAKQREFTLTTKEVTLSYQQTVFYDAAHYYEVLCWTLPEDFQSALAGFEDILASIRLSDSQVTSPEPAK
jgi:hypothetical protein